MITTIAISLAIVVIGTIVYIIFAPVDFGNTVSLGFAIKNGQGVYEVANGLKDGGLIQSRNIFILYVRLIGVDKELKAGRYSLSPAMSLYRVVNILSKGLSETEDILVTIPEGFNIWEIDRRFAATNLIIAGQISKNYKPEEGHLFPDTYRFDKEISVNDIIDKLEQNYYYKDKNPSDKSLIIASLLEKEAKTEEDMKIISGIIEKRLKMGIALQLDASVAYGWCIKQSEKPSFSGFCDVTQAPIAAEIKIDGPYNTYARKGLPEGPISNPGIAALEAAENPRESDYLYYLSTRDGSQIIYAKTPAEQAANRRKYLGI